MDKLISPDLKPPATFKEQIQILKNRSLIIKDDDYAIRTLQRINYYRLSAYGLSLKNNDKYHEGVTFEHIHELYEFDHRFRYLIMEMIEQVEIAFRTHIAYHLAHKYGPLGHLNFENFENTDYHNSSVVELNKEIKRSQEIFIKHHVHKYNRQIPIWVAVEVMSFGALSKLFSNMKIEDRNFIAKTNYRAPSIYLESWLKCLSYIRNICAHYGRLYNRPLTSKPRLNPTAKKYGIRSNYIFAMLYILKQLIPDRRKWNHSFLIRLQALLTEYEHVVDLDRIGFLENWEQLLKK